MKKLVLGIGLLIASGLIAGCAGQDKHHARDMPDPEGYNAHFGDIDGNGDGVVKWYEFKAYFPDAAPEVYLELDMNDDGGVGHDEWHQFKEAHGMTHQ